MEKNKNENPYSLLSEVNGRTGIMFNTLLVGVGLTIHRVAKLIRGSQEEIEALGPKLRMDAQRQRVFWSKLLLNEEQALFILAKLNRTAPTASFATRMSEQFSLFRLSDEVIETPKIINSGRYSLQDLCDHFVLRFEDAYIPSKKMHQGLRHIGWIKKESSSPTMYGVEMGINLKFPNRAMGPRNYMIISGENMIAIMDKLAKVLVEDEEFSRLLNYPLNVEKRRKRRSK